MLLIFMSAQTELVILTSRVRPNSVRSMRTILAQCCRIRWRRAAVRRHRETFYMFDLMSVPEVIRGPSAWYGPQMAASTEWLEYLSDAEIDEIDAATHRLVSDGKDIPSIRKEDFPLPTLGLRLRGILHEILNGRGFVLLRGLPVERWSKFESATAFFGLGTHLGNARSQNAQ